MRWIGLSGFALLTALACTTGNNPATTSTSSSGGSASSSSASSSAMGATSAALSSSSAGTSSAGTASSSGAGIACGDTTCGPGEMCFDPCCAGFPPPCVDAGQGGCTGTLREGFCAAEGGGGPEPNGCWSCGQPRRCIMRAPACDGGSCICDLPECMNGQTGGSCNDATGEVGCNCA